MKYLKLMILFFAFFHLSANAQSIDYDFFRPAQEEVFEQGIYCIYKDNYGFLWIGTSQGLYRYDGYVYKSYHYQPGNNSSICNNNIRNIIEDKEGYIWIGTFNGLSRYNRKQDNFSNYYFDVNNSDEINTNQIKDLIIDQENRFWVALNNGINEYIPEKDSFYTYSAYLPDNIKAGRNIVRIVADLENNLWIGTWNSGLVKFNTSTKEFTHFSQKIGNPDSLQNNQIVALTVSDDSILWIGHWDQGFCRLNLKTLKFDYSLYNEIKSRTGNGFDRILIDMNKNVWLSSNKNLMFYERNRQKFHEINSSILLNEQSKATKANYLYQDKDSVLWINTIDDGFFYLHPFANNFNKYYRKLPRERDDIVQNYAKSFLEDPYENLWIATFDDGLIKFGKDGTFKRFLNQSGDSDKSLGSNRINHLLLDNNNLIWVSTANGIAIINPVNDRIEKKIDLQTPQKDGLYFNFISKIFQDSKGNYWIINQEGIDFYNPEEQSFKHFNQNDLNGFSHYKFTSIEEDNRGNLWFGTENGLNRFDYESGKIKHFFHIPESDSSLSNSTVGFVKYIHNQLWICTPDGLNQYDYDKGNFKRFPNLERILGKNVTRVLEGDSSNIWIISKTGLTIFNIYTLRILNYGKSENLNISTEAFYRTPKGRFYIGGAHKDFYTFSSVDIKVNTTIPSVYITNFLLFNKPLSVSSEKLRTPLKENIIEAKKIELKYNQNSFGFEFTSLNYLFPEKNKFAYKLTGFEEDWNYTDYERRYANYTNLRPGTYVFHVIASNNDGVWNTTGAQLEIIIAPPYWQTWYAYLFYLIVLVLILYFARYLTIKQTRLKSSLETEHLLREREEEAHKQRIAFFTNISHEFRTPLTLISGPLKQINKHSKKSEWDDDLVSYLNLIKRNVKRLTELTNQLLDFRKIEAGKEKVELFHGDIVQFLKGVTDAFTGYAQKKHIKLQFESENPTLEAFFDGDKLEKIVSNLISNAIKFTEVGSVTVKVKEFTRTNIRNEKWIKISVEDTGIGIPNEQLKNVFNPFHQVEISQLRKNEGTGLGLALTVNLVKLCNGEIEVDSQLGKGSCFTVVLPIEKESFTNYAINNAKTGEDESKYDEDFSLEQVENKGSGFTTENQNLPLVLIVEDNQDMRSYIAKILSESYRIIDAADGNEGLDKAFKHIPDVIISDIMMPVISGTELTRRIKTDERTNHIPVILLTALTATSQKIEGLNTGADDYITKPFNDELLRLKIDNLLKTRQKIKEQLLKQINLISDSKPAINLQPSSPELENSEEKFIKKLLTIIEANIEEVDFGVDKLAKEVGLEASTLYKKLMSMIDMSPGEFIRDIRLKRAAQLLSHKELNITDISFMVGYDDPKYFSKIFKKYHSVTPSEYRNRLY